MRAYFYENHSGSLTFSAQTGYVSTVTVPASVFEFGVNFTRLPNTEDLWSGHQTLESFTGRAPSLEVFDEVQGWRLFDVEVENGFFRTETHYNVSQTISFRIRNFFQLAAITWTGFTFYLHDDLSGIVPPEELPDHTGGAMGAVFVLGGAGLGRLVLGGSRARSHAQVIG